MASRDSEGIITYGIDEAGLITIGYFSGAVPTTANKFTAGCFLVGSDGKAYTNGGSSAAPSFQDINSIQTGEIATGAVTLAKLASGITSSHIVKFFKLGSTITGTTLVGVAVNDLVVTIVGDGTVTVAVASQADTLPADPADTSYVIVFRAAA